MNKSEVLSLRFDIQNRKNTVKNLPLFLSGLSLVGVIALFAMQFSKPSTETPENNAEVTVDDTAGVNYARIAIVNQDSLGLYYDFLEEQNNRLNAAREKQARKLRARQEKFQKEAYSFQSRLEGGLLSQQDAENIQRKLAQDEQEIMREQQSYNQGMTNERIAIQDTLFNRLHKFLDEYNKDDMYDFVFLYTKGSGIWYDDNKAVDITEPVIEGLNKEYAAQKEAEGSK
ncbi:MAG: OmpH family outer membrane protein [Bacteroidota bacterium]